MICCQPHRVRAAERAREHRHIGFLPDRAREQLAVALLRHFGRAEHLQVIGEELRVEQLDSRRPQPRDEMHQRDLRGIARAMEHALAEERAPEAHAVKPADQRVAVIDLDGVAMADVEQPAIELADRRVDPGARALRAGLRAAVDHGGEIAVARRR